MTDAIDSGEFDALLEYLERTRGFDFSAYKQPSLIRRVQRRMQAVGIDRYSGYIDYLEVHPDEFARLFDAILINVTGFFRDQSSWDYLRDDVLPVLLASRSEAEPIRVWSAGCASGEEGYSIAILLAEAMGRDQFRERVKIYATDIDEHALNQARQASYTEKQIQGVPPGLVDRYFKRDDQNFVFDAELRRSVIFGRHDLVQDAPISRIDILICRNCLMYFHTEAQSRILARFHFALVGNGVLFLGKAELLVTHSRLFAPIDLRRRIFRKVSKDSWRDRMALVQPGAGEEGQAADHSTLVPAAFEVGPLAEFIVDTAGALAVFNERARVLFNLVPADVGRPVQDLELSYRPVELRSLIERAFAERRPISVTSAEWASPGRPTRFFDVSIAPLTDASGRSIGASVSFCDVSPVQELQNQLTRSKQDLETANEELQSTNEELETTNEELQSTVEELETTNEELQSTNEELETVNEELQSTNADLQSMNLEISARGDALNRMNSFLESILAGVRSGVVVLDRELQVIAWNHRAEDLWGVRTHEAKGQNFLNLDIGLPTDSLRPVIRACLNGDAECPETVVAATNRRGRSIVCKVIGTPLAGGSKEPRGVILLMDEQPLTAVSN
jgi:two-component system CheB/CheR fusion protein